MEKNKSAIHKALQVGFTDKIMHVETEKDSCYDKWRTEKHFVLFIWEIRDYYGVVSSMVSKWSIAPLKVLG